MKSTTLFFFVLLTTTGTLYAQNSDIDTIKNILHNQEKAWSDQDLEGFMEGYWKSEDLTYYSGGRITKGWQTTLDNYKKGYPTQAEIGTLNFKIDQISKITEDSYYVMGQYFLVRDVGDANGTFMIIFKRINGEWKIIADSSC
ncbi:YybH family protein [Zobellia russellii]|uniref:YybH family protein n=1 Tax=Zobellia russellii TaxID=248907 RepID=UPI0037DCEC35